MTCLCLSCQDLHSPSEETWDPGENTSSPYVPDTAIYLPEESPEDSASLPIVGSIGSGDTDGVGMIGDTLLPPKPDTAKAELAYQYPESIQQKEVRDIWVKVKVRSTPGAVKAALQSHIIDYKQEVEGNDTAHIFTSEMGVYDYLTVRIEDPGGDFILLPLHVQQRQKIDEREGNVWHWTIQTNSDKAKSVLILHLISDNGDTSDPQWVSAKQIPIRIKLETNWHRRIYTWLINNPEYVTGTLLVPFILYIGRQLRRRTKGKKNGAPNQD